MLMQHYRSACGLIAITVSLQAAPLTTMAYEQAFTATPVGDAQIRSLPAGRYLVTAVDGTYFDHSGLLFNRLFAYIKANNLAMTVPVEGRLEPAEMRFYLGSDVAKVLEETDEIRVVDVPERFVASLGGGGSYSADNVNEVCLNLKAWIESQTEWRVVGAPYAVFWNGPFTPWFLKRFEVHVPVTRR